MKGARLSRIKKQITGHLGELSSQEYYAFIKLKNPVNDIRPIVGDELFKKFDRGKPLNDNQINTIVAAINQVVFEPFKSLIPYSTPVIVVKRNYDVSSTRSIYSLSQISLFRMEKYNTPDGNGYLACDNTVTYGDHTGRVLFSKHAIDRLLERQPKLIELSKVNTEMIIKVMRQCIKKAKVEIGSVGPQLKCDPIGFFPMIWEKELGMWMLTTFLDKDMRGTADQVIQKMKADWAELSQKYHVQKTR